jgi:AraC-like DNA-binding protein
VQASDVSADARVLHPVAALASVVECYRIGSFVGPRGGQLVTVSPPTWQTELVVGCEPCMEDHAPDGSRPLKPAAFFFGPMQSERGATLHTIPAGTRVASVLFRAGAGPLLFDVSAAETLDQVLDARALLGPEHRGELDRIPDAGSDDALRAALDALLLRLSLTAPLRARRALEDLSWWSKVVHAGLDVHSLARHSSLTARQIERRYKDALGMSPTRVRRIQRFRDAARGIVGTPRLSLAQHAALHGYADQSHMTREFRALAGVSPRRYAEKRRNAFYLDAPIVAVGDGPQGEHAD